MYMDENVCACTCMDMYRCLYYVVGMGNIEILITVIVNITISSNSTANTEIVC